MKDSFFAIKKYYIYVIMLVQTALILFSFSGQGSFYYWDSFYSFRTAHYASGSTPDNHNIIDDPEFTPDEWMDVGYVRDNLVVDRDESVLADPITYTVRNWLRQPYWVTCNLVEAIFTPGEFSGWPIIGLGVILFIITQLMLYRLVIGIGGQPVEALLTIVMFGFCGMTVSVATYVRFYIYSAMLCVAFTYLHMLIWDTPARRWYRILIYEALAMLLVLWNISISQFSLFYVCVFIFAFLIVLGLHRRFAEMLVYGLPIVAGGILYLIKNPVYLDMLFHPHDVYAVAEGPTHWVLEKLLTLTPLTFAERSVHEFSLIAKYGFGYVPAFLLFMVLLVWFMIRLVRHRRSAGRSKQGDTDPGTIAARPGQIITHPLQWVMLATMVGYIIIACALHFYTEMRYSIHVFPLIAWFAGLMLVRITDELMEVIRQKWASVDCRLAYIPVILIIISVLVGTLSGRRVVYVYDYGDDVVSYLDQHAVDYVVISQWDTSHGDSTDIVYQTTYLFDDDVKFVAVKGADEISDKLPEEFIYATRIDTDDARREADEYYALGFKAVWTDEVGVYRFYHLVRESGIDG